MRKKIKICSDYSGAGAFIQALRQSKIDFEELFACDMDKFARETYCLNYGTENDVALARSAAHQKMCDALLDLAKKGLEPHPELASRAEEMAREYSFYFPFDVNLRQIPEEDVDVYGTSPPCQAFSMAGQRLGKDDRRGILFFNSVDFIRIKKPRFFWFENVEGLLSHDRKNKKAEFGNTFQEWLNYLGGKSINGKETIFPYEDSVPYHIYHHVLNAKQHGTPQNRKRVFIIGIRDDEDNSFTWPKKFPLKRKLRDCLEPEVDAKYYLSQKMIDGFIRHADKNAAAGNGFGFSPISEDEEAAATILSGVHKMHPGDNYIKVGFINQDTQASAVHSPDGVAPTLSSGPHGYANGYIIDDEVRIVKMRRTQEAKAKRRENFAKGKGDTGLFSERIAEFVVSDVADTIVATPNPDKDGLILESVDRTPKISIEVKTATEKGYETATEEDSINFSNPSSKTRRGRVGKGVAQTLDTACNQGVLVSPDGKVWFIRRLTPRECFRLMDFPDDFVWSCSDTQAYRQAGNSIVRGLISQILERLPL